jgi:hypothetical protein
MLTRSLMFGVLMTVSTVSVAHHSFAMFDASQRATMHGKVRAIEWTNPHVWIWVNRQEGSGEPIPYGFELASPGENTRNYGWKKNSLAVGDEVTVEYAPLRSGKNGGALARVTLPNGQVLFSTGEHILPPKPGEKPRGAPPADKPSADHVKEKAPGG